MTRDHVKVLRALDDLTRPGGEYCVPFAPLESETGLPRPRVRFICRHLARKGLAEFHAGLIDEDGEFCGAGYCISRTGQALVADLSDAKGAT